MLRINWLSFSDSDLKDNAGRNLDVPDGDIGPLDQAIVLHEALTHPTTSVILMVIQSAYDEINRRILRQMLEDVFGFDNVMIKRLQDYLSTIQVNWLWE
ncbi:hypothetical protein HDU83_007297, partial [Entophlyctis luteolus]